MEAGCPQRNYLCAACQTSTEVTWG